ncbi:hypothetical protein QQ045_021370 [Rhodiola kirilowii]
MHGCSSESAFLVNAEVDSMGGVIDGVVGIGIMTSPCLAEIERAQEEIRLEIDSREERLRELEFLEKGGDPLDFKFSQAVSVSVQSTSLTDQHPEQIVTSKAKDSYASAALRTQHGVAAESIGKPGDTTCEANSGDNLLLFDDEKKLDKDKNFKARSGQNTAAPSVISSRTVGNHKAKGSESSAIFRPYARRNRSKSNRDGARSASMDVSHARNQGSAQFRNGTWDAKGLLSDANRKDQKLSSFCKLKSSNRIHEMVQKNDTINNVESVVMPTADKLTNVVHGSRKEHALDVKTNGDLLGSRKDPEKSQDATSCGAGIEAQETKVLANCGSFLTGATRSTLQTGVVSQPDVVSKTINSTHPDSTLVNLDIHSPIHDSVSCAKLVDEHPNELHKEPFLVADEARKPVIEDPLEINIDPNPIDPGSVVIGGDSVHQDTKSSSVIKVEEDIDLQNKSVASESLKMTELKDLKELEALKNQDNVIDYFSSPRNGDRAEVQTSTTSLTDKDVPDAACDRKLTDKTDEDSILAEAKIIQAKRRRIAELSMRSLPSKNCQKSHWDFLLEEVAWLANDFMQERLWKVKAAAQLGRHTALASHIRDQKQMPVQRLRFVAHSLAKAVMEFWQTSEMPDGPDSLEPQNPHKSFALKSYALRFMKYNSSTLPSIKVEDPVAPNDMHDLGMQQTSGESCITENYLFYTIPPGAMQCYRTSIESYVLQCEKNGSMQREDVSQINGANEEMYLDKVYDEDEGETSTHCLPGTVEWSKASQLPHKKQKGLKRTYSSASYELGADFANGSHMPGTQKSVLMVKQPSSQNHGSIPTKRMRTASRQRMLGSHSGASTVKMLAMNMTGASSEDTNSYQDDQSSLHFGSQLQRSLEVESPVDYEKYLPTDSGEISTKHKKKKVDHSKRRLDRHHLDSNGSNGLFGQHRNKKFKLSKQTFENVLDNGAPISGSMPSPAASQMSNMANANEYKKIIANGDRFKKIKGTKLPIPMPGSGNAWTLFEDQALVVLVHDLGPNWYLVSDALNSTLRLKHIFREPKDCKERHKVLMDQTAGDGADSADDSGSSQPYPSTMPGIPKGSARQLFQRLRGPIEEDMVKSHFERIIMIGQKQHHHRKHCDFRDQKHLIPPHSSHVIAISQVSSNNVNGGFLTPLDLIDAIMSSPDALGYQCPQTNGFTNQSCGTSALSPHDIPVGSLSSPSGPLSHRNGRYGVSVTSLPVDDQQRIQQLNPLLAGRNIQQSTIPIPGPRPLADRFGPRKLQGGNGMGMVNGINNRGNPMSRPGFQGLGSGALLSSGMVGMQGLEMQSVISSSQGNSMQRPMDNSHQIRPGQSLEHPRQKMAPEMQMRAAQANNRCITPVNGLNGSYTGQTVPSSGTSHSFHPQQKHQQPNDLMNPRHSHLKVPNHAVGSQHPAYARLAKERQLQQQMFQQQQYTASNATMTQAQPQLPVSIQNNPQVQPQSSQGFSHSSLTPSSATPIYSQLHQKHHLPPHGNVRDSQSSTSSLPNQITKQGQRHPQQQQSFRPHTAQHCQQLQSQPGKQFKSEVKGNMNVTLDQSNLNGQSLSPSQGGQSTNEEEHAVLVQGSQNSGQPSRSLGLNVSSQNLLHHPPNQMQQVAPLDNGNLGVPHQATSSNLVSSPNYPPIQVPSSSHLNHVGQNQVNIARGPENSHLVSQLDDQTVNSDAPSVGSAALLQGWQAPDSLQNAYSQLPGNDSSLVGPGSIQKHLSGGVVSSVNSVGDRWQEKSRVPNPLAPSTSQQQE